MQIGAVEAMRDIDRLALAVQLGSAGSLLCSVMVMVSPDLTSIAGAT